MQKKSTKAESEAAVLQEWQEKNGCKLPIRRCNLEYRSREYLTEDEVMRLIDAAGSIGRHGHRDSTMILLSFRHGLRTSELVGLRWDQIDLERGVIHVNRIKRGNPSVHPLGGPEITALRMIRAARPNLPHVFVSERNGPFTPDAVRKIVTRAGKRAELPFQVHHHMLRHGCGYKLAQAGQDTRRIQDYLGHRNIQHTVRYTQLSHDRFKGFWND